MRVDDKPDRNNVFSQLRDLSMRQQHVPEDLFLSHNGWTRLQVMFQDEFDVRPRIDRCPDEASEARDLQLCVVWEDL